MPLLEVRNLQVQVEENEILHGLSLAVNKGEVHAIMGPNGSGKSTLSHVIAGKPGYEVTGGEILFNGEDLLAMAPDERSAGRVSRVPISGGNSGCGDHDLPAHGAERRARRAARANFPRRLSQEVRSVARLLNIPQDMLRRGVNVGSPAARRSATRFCKWRLSSASLCILMKWIRPRHRRAAGRRRRRQCAALAGSRHGGDHALQRLLNYIVPDFVHVSRRAGS